MAWRAILLLLLLLVLVMLDDLVLAVELLNVPLALTVHDLELAVVV